MLKLVCSYSRKGPGDEEYSSRQFHAGLEQELSVGLTPAQLDTKVHATFEQLRQAVEAELNGTAAKGANGPTGNGHAVPAPMNGVAKGNGHANGNARKITNSQAKFALDLARKAGLKLADLDQRVRDEYGVNSLYELGAGQASALIETLKAHKAA